MVMQRDKQKAENIIKEAQDKAERIVAEAIQKTEDIVKEAKQQMTAPGPKTSGRSSGGKREYVLVNEKNDTAVIHCNDRRFQDAFEQFVENELGMKFYSPFVVPGASQLLAFHDSLPKFSSALMRYLQFMVKHRAIKNVVIIMHEDCAWYHHFVPKFVEMRRTQKDQEIADMLSAKTLLQEEFPEIKIRLFYASITPDKKVEFSEVAAKAH